MTNALLTCGMQVIGREREVARVIQILGRRTKNNPILLGEPGVLPKHKAVNDAESAQGPISVRGSFAPCGPRAA